MELPIAWVLSFVAVYEHGHLGRAAKARHLTTSAVSKHVGGLERGLGVTLFDRCAAGVEPTAAGHRFAEAASDLVRCHRAARVAARAATPARTVHIGILAGLPFSRTQFDYVRAAVALWCPGWSVSPRAVRFDAIADSVLSGEVDVLWTAAAPRRSGIAAAPIGAVPRLGLVARGRADEARTTLAVTDFAEQPLLYNPQLPPEWMAPMCLADIRPIGQARLVPTAATDFGAVLSLVARGSGVAISGTPPPGLATLGVRPVHLEGLAPMPIHAAYRHGDKRSAVAALVAALPGARLGQPPSVAGLGPTPGL